MVIEGQFCLLALLNRGRRRAARGFSSTISQAFSSILKELRRSQIFIFAVRPYAHGLSMHTLRTHDKHLKNLGNDDAVENDGAGRGTYLRKHEVFQFQSHASKHGGRRELCLLCTKSR